MRDAIIQKVLDKKIIAIVRGVYGYDALNLARALCAGGIEMLEATFDQSKPEFLGRTADTIQMLSQELGDKMIFGAGTVTTVEMVHMAKNAGAKFIVSPDCNPDVICETVAAGMVSMPGAMTPTEIRQAYAAGADFVKVFPAGTLGSGYIKAIRGPLNNIPLLAVGGVSEKNAGEFMKAGCVGVGVGGNLVNRDWITQGQWDRITALAKELCASVNG